MRDISRDLISVEGVTVLTRTENVRLCCSEYGCVLMSESRFKTRPNWFLAMAVISVGCSLGNHERSKNLIQRESVTNQRRTEMVTRTPLAILASEYWIIQQPNILQFGYFSRTANSRSETITEFLKACRDIVH